MVCGLKNFFDNTFVSLKNTVHITYCALSEFLGALTLRDVIAYLFNVLFKGKRLYSLSVFLCLYLYFSYLYMQIGTFLRLENLHNLSFVSSHLCVILAFISLVRMLVCKSYKCFISALAILLCTFISYTKVPQFRLLFEVACLSVMCFGVSHKIILKAFLFSVGLLFVATNVLMLTGTLPDLVYFVHKEGISFYRHSFGMVYPTDYAAEMLFLCLTLFCLLKKTYFFISVGVLALLIYFQILFTHTRNTEFVMGLSIIFFVFYVMWQRISLFPKGGFIRGVYKFLAVGMFPFCAILTISLAIVYDGNVVWMNSLNSLISDRLAISHNMYNLHGISLFGHEIPLVGNGSTVVSMGDYNFLDITYVQLLIKFGMVSLLLFAFTYMLTQYRAINNNCYSVSMCFILVCIHSCIEHHYIEPCYNPFILLIFADFKSKENSVLSIFTQSFHQLFVQVRKRVTVNCGIPFPTK